MTDGNEEMVGDGFRINVLGRSGLTYTRGSRTATIDGEMLVGSFDFVVYTGSIRDWDGSAGPITDEEKKQILADIEAAFRSSGLAVDFE